MINSKDDYSEEEYNASLQNINENIEDISKALINLNQGVSNSVQLQNEFLMELKEARRDNNDSYCPSFSIMGE